MTSPKTINDVAYNKTRARFWVASNFKAPARLGQVPVPWQMGSALGSWPRSSHKMIPFTCFGLQLFLFFSVFLSLSLSASLHCIDWSSELGLNWTRTHLPMVLFWLVRRDRKKGDNRSLMTIGGDLIEFARSGSDPEGWAQKLNSKNESQSVM